ncbi:MAG: hypothetical protein JO362_14275 [Streptomycetaceae bacterium]|nr:hypothetical protein [Streptomycetaceae bacterium]
MRAADQPPAPPFHQLHGRTVVAIEDRAAPGRLDPPAAEAGPTMKECPR